ncbi:MAG: efflux transporter outer membrane subunit [Planctomycetes bacterium]|nr:efflux transporter outer membrane subunit [Planctomycetota bacterium]
MIPHCSPRAWLALLPLGLAACAITPPERSYEIDSAETPAEWSAEGVPGDVDLEAWWRQFGDEDLATQVELALEHNRDLAAAAARVHAAEAQARIAGAALKPSLDAGVDARRSRQNYIGFPIPGGGGDVLSSTSQTLGVSLDLAWELDLWGRLAAGERAALEDYEATRADYAGAQLSIAGQTAKAWLALAEARLQLKLAEETVQSFRRNTEFVRRRYEQGRIEPLELRLAENNLAGAESLLYFRAEQIERVARQLQILTGVYPDGVVEADELPGDPAAIPAGVPSDLLRRRPDLASAEARLAAADYRLWEARKALWPSIRLTASAGRTSAELEDLLKESFDVWSLAGGIVQPIFDGGRLRAAIDAADARAREALANYGQRSLVAFGEVETALSTQEHMEGREEALERAAQQAEAAQALAERQYQAGTTNLLAVLESQRRALNARAEQITSRRERLDNRIDLYLALGGGFDADAQADTVPPSADAR